MRGVTRPGKPRADLPTADDYASAIILPSAKTIAISNAQVELSGFLIWRQGLVTPTYPTISDSEAQAIISDFAGTAITVTADDPHIHSNMIIGFAKAIDVNTVFRPSIHNNYIDCTNGIEAQAIYDAGEGSGICNNSCRPYLIQSQPYVWKTNRHDGTGFYFHDGADGLNATGNFAYGHTIGLHVKNSYAGRFGGWFDNIAGGAPADATGTTGVFIEGDCHLSVFDVHIDSHDVGLNIESDVGQISVKASLGLAITNHIKFGIGSSGSIDALLDGSSITPLFFSSGDGEWSGHIVTKATAVSGVLVYLENFPDDSNKLRNLCIHQIGTNYPRLVPNTMTVTYSGLPTNSAEGDEAFVVDSTVNSFGAPVIAGGGAYKVKVILINGAWKVCAS